MSASPRIAIIGAGPAGLTLTRILQVNGVTSTVFEKDPSSQYRAAIGGSLDVHEGSGQDAIRAAELWDEFQKYARYDAQAYILSDETGHQYINIRDTDLGRPEIDRPHLCKMLLGSLQVDTVRWNHKLKRVDADGTLHFETNGATDKIVRGFDLVIGADGAWSKVRELLCHVPPLYSGLAGYELRIVNPDTECPDVSAITGNGSHMVFGKDDEKALMLQRQSDRSIVVYTFMRKPESWYTNNGIVNKTDRDEVKAAMLREYGHWAPIFKRVLEAVNERVIPRPLYMMHVGTRWRHKAGFTLIGDAAHLMTPFAGEGVNVALHDAVLLAQNIIANREHVDSAAEEYERDMFPRAANFQQITWDSLQARFERGGNEKLAEGFRRVAEDKKNSTGVIDGSRPDQLFSVT